MGEGEAIESMDRGTVDSPEVKGIHQETMVGSLAEGGPIQFVKIPTVDGWSRSSFPWDWWLLPVAVYDTICKVSTVNTSKR